MIQDYDLAKATLAEINKEVDALRARERVARMPNMAARKVIHEKAVNFGFRRDFNGNYFLNKKLFSDLQTAPAVDLTPEGLQTVFPGCEKDQERGPAQLSLW